MGGINISNYPQLKNDYSCFLSITKERTTVPKDTVTVDSFVFVTSPYTSSALGEAARAFWRGIGQHRPALWMTALISSLMELCRGQNCRLSMRSC